ncbi:MAG: GNAT family N-acetyltransferase [Clostridium sp.]
MIREVYESEIEIICEYKLNMFRDSGHEGLLNPNAKEMIIAKYKELYKSVKGIHFVKVIDGKIIACCGAFIKEDIPYCFYNTTFYGFIGDVYTLPEFRNKGYASELVDRAIEWLKRKEVHEIALLAADNARKMYEKKGFRGTDEMRLRNI